MRESNPQKCKSPAFNKNWLDNWSSRKSMTKEVIAKMLSSSIKVEFRRFRKELSVTSAPVWKDFRWWFYTIIGKRKDKLYIIPFSRIYLTSLTFISHCWVTFIHFSFLTLIEVDLDDSFTRRIWINQTIKCSTKWLLIFNQNLYTYNSNHLNVFV